MAGGRRRTRPKWGGRSGDGQEHGDDPAWDAVEANALYDLLEREVIPEFYARDGSGIPTAWVARMRESMARLTPRFSTNRTVREYTEQHYLPAASAYRKRAADNGAVGKDIVDWQRTLREKWAALRFGDVKVETSGAQHVFEVDVSLNDLDPEAVRVELYADGISGGPPERREMARTGRRDDRPGRYVYSADRARGPPTRRTTRRELIPHCDGVAVPLGSRLHSLAAVSPHYDPNETKPPDHDDLPGHRGRAAHRRLGSSCPQARRRNRSS